MAAFTLKKSEILSSKKEIALLFKNPVLLFKYPFKLYYSIEPANNDEITSLKYAVSIPKKNIKKAAKRNLLKRRTKESFRLLKGNINTDYLKGKNINIMFVYISSDIEEYSNIYSSIEKLIQKLNIELKR
ncbi:MAG: ribonuclease P protein component [Saprospiraceae bacterium]